MIYVVRSPQTTEVQAALAKRGRDNLTEIEKARAYYSQTPRPTKAYHFLRYKEPAVCRALDDLFHEKCAYCESRYRAVTSGDVEHFRPKAGVTESPKHPGYWWLAAVWRNLLPSCPFCNQSRYHMVFDPGMTLEEFERARLKEPERLTGKANSFPVQNDNWVMTENDDITVEDPLLINPCERDPASHLEFIFDWDHRLYIWNADMVTALVVPKLIAGKDDHYALASIGIYGLNRAGLVRERADRVRDLQLPCQFIVDLADFLEGSPSPDELTRIGNLLKKYKAKLIEYTQPHQLYAGMARAFLLQFEEELKRLANNTT